MAKTAGNPNPTAMDDVLGSCRSAFVAIGLTSGVVNLLMLTGSLFMIQVYDRVLSSHSVPTLLALTVMVTIAYVFQGGLDYIRSRMLALIGERLDTEVGPKVMEGMATIPLRSSVGTMESMQPSRDLDAIRNFAAGSGPTALFDLPWSPIYLALCFVFHPVLGLTALLGAAVLVSLTLTTEWFGAGPAKTALSAQSERNQHAEAIQRGAEVVQAMGMLPNLATRWHKANGKALEAHRSVNVVMGGIGAIAKTFRYLLQSIILAAAAYLAVKNEISAGTIIAASILSGRMLQPVDQMISSWKHFVAARQGYSRVQKLLALTSDADKKFDLPPPSQSLKVQGLRVTAPGTNAGIVENINFEMKAGQALGIIGPSASGKSSLTRALVGIWPASRGEVLLDNASIEQWKPEKLGPSIGYLPQDVQLFDGTVAENIARFAEDINPEAVIEAAKAASFHDHILALPKGYDTPVGRGGSHLSSGQKQRLGLARALYANPFLIVLDEPNANLDAEGEQAVTHAIVQIKRRGGIVIVVAHRPSAIAATDLIMVIRDGRLIEFGPRDEVLAKTVQNVRQVSPKQPALQGLKMAEGAVG